MTYSLGSLQVDLDREREKSAKLMEALKRIQRLSERCRDLPDTDGIRNACRDIDVAARIAIERAEPRS